MKKIILSLLVAGSLSLNAQDLGFSKGNIAVSGTLGYNSSESAAGAKTSTFSISPSGMYMVNSNWGIMGMINYTSTDNSTIGVAGGNKTTGFAFGAGANYYFMKGAFSPFVGFGGAIGFPSSSVTSPLGVVTTAPTTTSISFNVTPGINYFVHKNWALSASIGLLNYTTTSVSGAPTSSSGFGLGLDFSKVGFGVSYIFK